MSNEYDNIKAGVGVLGQNNFGEVVGNVNNNYGKEVNENGTYFGETTQEESNYFGKITQEESNYFGGIEQNENNFNTVGENINTVNTGINYNGETITENSGLPMKTNFWTKVKSVLFREVKIELTPHQKKIEKEINDFLHQEITWEKVHDFLFQEVTFRKRK